jgi:hypothetical protein
MTNLFEKITIHPCPYFGLPSIGEMRTWVSGVPSHSYEGFSVLLPGIADLGLSVKSYAP